MLSEAIQLMKNVFSADLSKSNILLASEEGRVWSTNGTILIEYITDFPTGKYNLAVVAEALSVLGEDYSLETKNDNLILKNKNHKFKIPVIKDYVYASNVSTILEFLFNCDDISQLDFSEFNLEDFKDVLAVAPKTGQLGYVFFDKEHMFSSNLVKLKRIKHGLNVEKNFEILSPVADRFVKFIPERVIIQDGNLIAQNCFPGMTLVMALSSSAKRPLFDFNTFFEKESDSVIEFPDFYPIKTKLKFMLDKERVLIDVKDKTVCVKGVSKYGEFQICLNTNVANNSLRFEVSIENLVEISEKEVELITTGPAPHFMRLDKETIIGISLETDTDDSDEA